MPPFAFQDELNDAPICPFPPFLTRLTHLLFALLWEVLQTLGKTVRQFQLLMALQLSNKNKRKEQQQAGTYCQLVGISMHRQHTRLPYQARRWKSAYFKGASLRVALPNRASQAVADGRQATLAIQVRTKPPTGRVLIGAMRKTVLLPGVPRSHHSSGRQWLRQGL